MANKIHWESSDYSLRLSQPYSPFSSVYSFDLRHGFCIRVTNMILRVCFSPKQARVCHIRTGLYFLGLHQLQGFQNRNKIIHFFPNYNRVKRREKLWDEVELSEYNLRNNHSSVTLRDYENVSPDFLSTR